MNIKDLHEEAMRWGGAENLVDAEGFMDQRFTRWVTNVLAALRAMPDAAKLVVEFTRLQRHHEQQINEMDARMRILWATGVIEASLRFVEKLAAK